MLLRVGLRHNGTIDGDASKRSFACTSFIVNVSYKKLLPQKTLATKSPTGAES